MKRYRCALVLGILALSLHQVGAEERPREELLRTTGTLGRAGPTLADGSTVHWFSLALPAGTRIAIRVVSVDFTPVIAISEPGSGTQLRLGRDGSAGAAHTVMGNTGLKVGISATESTSNPGDFSIRITRLPAQEQLSVGAQGEGVLSYDDQSLGTGEPVDWWDLRVGKGDRIVIVAESHDFVPAIIGDLPGGVALNPERSSEGVSIVRFTSGQNATLRVGIAASNPGERGSYQIAVFRPSPPVPVDVGKTVTGSLSETDDMFGGQPVDTYEITGKPGERVIINLSSESFDPLLIVQEPNGTLEGNDDLSEENLNSGLSYSFRENMALEIRVYAVNRKERGTYNLRVSRAAPVQSVVPGSRLRGRLSIEDEQFEGVYADRYLLQGEAGQAVTIYLESEEFDTYLILIGPDGTPFENDDLDDEQSNSALHFVFDTGGVAEILVTGYSNEDMGEYLLRVEQREPDGSVPDSTQNDSGSEAPAAVQFSA